MRDALIISAPEDRAFALRLNDALIKHGYTTWLWEQETPPASNEWASIYAEIEGADNILLVLSPDFIESDMARQQLDFAAQHNKRLIPLVWRETNSALLDYAIQQWPLLPFRESDDFLSSLQRVMAAINDDQGYVRLHSDLLIRSREWEQNWRKPRNLLRGVELRAAEAWLARSTTHAVEPIERQIDYILASQRAADSAQRRILAVVMLAFLATVVLAGLGFIYFLNAPREPKSASEVIAQTEAANATAIYQTAQMENSRFDTQQAELQETLAFATALFGTIAAVTAEHGVSPTATESATPTMEARNIQSDNEATMAALLTPQAPDAQAGTPDELPFFSSTQQTE